VSDMDDYVRGQFKIYCECVARGCKKIAELLIVPPVFTQNDKGRSVVLLPTKEKIEKIKRVALEIADEYKVKVHFCVERGVFFINGKRKDYNEHNAVIYKNEKYLKEYLDILEHESAMDPDEYHRRLGRLFGYGNKEIEEFIKEERRKRSQGGRGGLTKRKSYIE